MSDKNVCGSGWHGAHGSTVTLKNDTKGPVTVSAASGYLWPFPDEDEDGFTIDAGYPKDVELADDPTDPNHSYGYDTKGCPGDPKNVNPKTVIID